MRQLKQLDTVSPLLESANYLSSVAKDYLTKVKTDQPTDKSQKHEEVNEHDSSFVDMFLDETQRANEGKSESQKDTNTEESTRKSRRATASKSILKTAFSETPGGVQKKISFARKATKVYEDNETSQISLAKSSGSVKSVNDYNPKALKPHLASNQKGNTSDVTNGAQMGVNENSKEASEDMFDDAESIVDTSFQEEIFSPAEPKNVKLFRVKNLTNFNTEAFEKDGSSKSAINQANIWDNIQETESDPLLSQEFPNPTQNTGVTMKNPKTDATVPFHNFVLTLPHDSSGSEASLDARVNMAINLVSTKPREAEIKQLNLPDAVQVPHNSTDGIIQSTVTCTDFRWMEPMEYNRGTSHDSSLEEIPNFEASKLSPSIFEEANKNLLPPFDIQIENETKIPETPFFGNQPQQTSFHGQENHPQMTSSVFPPKPTWANPFQSSIAHSSTFHQSATINPMVPEQKPAENAIKIKIQGLGERTNYGNYGNNGEDNNIPREQEEIPDTKQIEEMEAKKIEEMEVQLRPTQEQLNQSKAIKISGQSQNLRSLTKSAEAMHEFPGNLQSTQKPLETVDKLQETYNSHKLAKTTKHGTRQAFKKALQNAVQTATTRQPAGKRQKEDSADTKTAALMDLPGQSSKAPQDDSKIARLRRFGEWCNNQSSTPLSDTEINPTRTQSNPNHLHAIGRSKSIGNMKTVQVKRQFRAKSKPSQGEDSQAARSKEQQSKLDDGKGKAKMGNYKINTKQEKVESLNKKTAPQGVKWANTAQNPISHLNVFPSSTPLPNTALVETIQNENPPRSDPSEGLTRIDTSSMICETSYSGEKSSQGQKKQTNSSQKENRASQNQHKPVTLRPLAKLRQSQCKASQAAGLKALPNNLEPLEATQVNHNMKVNTAMIENYHASVENPNCQAVTKRSRGRQPKSGNGRNPTKKSAVSSTLEQMSTSTSFFEPQPVSPFENYLSSNMDSNVLHQQELETPEVPQTGHNHNVKVNTAMLDNYHASQENPNRQAVTKRGRGRQPKSVNGRNPAKKRVLSCTLEQMPTSTNYFEQPQPVRSSENYLFSNMAANLRHQQGLQSLKQDLHQAQQCSSSSKQGFSQPGACLPNSKPSNLSLKQDSDRTEPSFLKFEQLQIVQNEPWLLNLQQDGKVSPMVPTSNKQDNRGASFFKPQPDKTSRQFIHLVNQSSNVVTFGQDRQTGWQFNIPPSSQDEPLYQSGTSAKAQSVLSEPQVQWSNMNWLHFGPINAAVDDRNDNGAETKKSAEASASSTSFPEMVPTLEHHMKENPRERTASSQTKKRAGKESTKQPKSTKIMKLQRNETKTNKDTDNVIRTSLGTQGTEVLYEVCENLSWASDDFVDLHMFETQTITTQLFSSQNALLQDVDFPVVSNHNSQRAENQGNMDENEPPLLYEAQTQLPWGFTAECEDPTSGFPGHQAHEIYKHHNNFGSSTNYAGNEKRSTSTSTTFIQDCNNTPLHQQHPNLARETIRNLSDISQPAYTEFKRGVQVSSTELAGNTTIPENSSFREPAKTEAEEVEELINTIEWIRRIPESELIEAANIEELINDQTFVW